MQIESKNLKAAIRALSAVATKENEAAPALSSVLLEFANGMLKMTGTNMETQVSVQVPAQMDMFPGKPVKIMVPFELFSKVIHHLDGFLTLRASDSELSIEANGATICLLPVDSDHQMPIMSFYGGAAVQMKAATLRDMLSFVWPYAAKDSLRPSLCGVLLQISNSSEVCAVATNAFILAKCKDSPVSCDMDSAEVLLPHSFIKAVLACNTEEGNWTLSISMDKRRILAEIGQFSIACRVIDAKFPDYQAVVPKNAPTVIKLITQDALKATSQAAITANETAAVIVKAAPNSMEFTSENHTGKSTVKIDCHQEGGNMEDTAFNAAYLSSIFASIAKRSSQVCINWTAANRAVVLTADDKGIADSDQMILIMPFSLNRT